MYQITNHDINLLLRQLSKCYHVKVEILENDMILSVLHGIVSGGSSSINANSEIRRTCNITIVPTWRGEISVNESSVLWINKDVRLYIGLKDIRNDEIHWYSNGYYVLSDSSATYDATTNSLTISCNDWMSKLDGSKNGQIGALTTVIPAYEEDKNTGEPIRYSIIREAMVSVITQLGRIKKYNIDDIGEYKAMPEYNDNWEQYRQENPLWNNVPYDLEFSSGCSVMSIIQELRDLYPNYETFFDEEGTFVCQMIPSCYHDDIVLSNDFFQKILISENTSVDLMKVRNICEVWGKVIDVDFYTDLSTYSKNVYTCSIDGYLDEYKNGDKVGIKICASNDAEAKININSFGPIPIYDENTELPIDAGVLDENTVYVFKIKKKYIKGSYQIKAILLGHWQAHGMNVLTDGSVGDPYVTTSGKTVDRYSKEYFQEVYNCESVEMTTIINSPFTVQKLGEILDVKTGGNYENITSDFLALSRAKYENWLTSRLTDSITIKTVLIPFLDVNVKISFKSNTSKRAHQYIIKSISHNFDDGTSSIQLMRFYPLYEELMRLQGTHEALSYYTHKELSKYTNDELKLIISDEDF